MSRGGGANLHFTPGKVQGLNAMQSRNCSHWSEAGTKTYFLLLCQSHSLCHESRIEPCKLHIRQFSVIELSFEPTEDGIDFIHAEDILFKPNSSSYSFRVRKDENTKILSVWVCAPKRYLERVWYYVSHRPVDRFSCSIYLCGICFLNAIQHENIVIIEVLRYQQRTDLVLKS